jgi:OOP family OmpA-OmpF porin
MKKNYYRPAKFIVFGAALGLGACASGPAKVDYPADTSPQAKMTELKNRLNEDQAKQYDELSPSEFQAAGKYLAKAQTQMDQSEPTQKVLDDEGEAAARLQILEDNASKNVSTLQPVLDARQAAMTAHARELQPKEFASADKDFRGFGSDIENGDFHPTAKEISALEGKYSAVELQSVKNEKLSGSNNMIQKAEKRGAKDKAPLTLAEAQVRYDTALRSIEANRRDPAGYQDAVNESNKASDKLDQVMNTIGSSSTSEMAAVKIYNQQQQIASTEQSLSQSQAQTQAAKNQTNAESTQVAAEQQTVSNLQAQNAEYANKAENNAKIETVKQEFGPKEAEVLRDGNKIILRLKDMKFSSARFELTQSSIETLQKVKDMIAAVPFSKVVVEGHTDNVGGEKKNMTLSQNRADAVKDYLVAEKSVPEGKVVARGYGYERPLDSNKTAEGRAVNRRVDVIIQSDADL